MRFVVEHLGYGVAPQFVPAHWLYALLSLTVVRMLSIATGSFQ